MKIIQDLITVNYQKGRKGAFPVDRIVIHVTQGGAASVRAWFKNPAAQASTHYMVTRAGEIVQFVREEDTAWGNGRVDHPTAQVVTNRAGSNPNWWTISIEHEGTGLHELTDAQRQSSLWLMRDIQKRHHRITFDRHHILRHNEIFSLKTCPGAIDVDRLVRELNAMRDFSDVTGSSSTTDPTP